MKAICIEDLGRPTLKQNKEYEIETFEGNKVKVLDDSIWHNIFPARLFKILDVDEAEIQKLEDELDSIQEEIEEIENNISSLESDLSSAERSRNRVERELKALKW